MGLFSSDKGKFTGKLTWEAIKNVGDSIKPQYMARTKVFGGWLVETQNWSVQNGGLTFIPDPNHEWKLEEIN